MRPSLEILLIYLVSMLLYLGSIAWAIKTGRAGEKPWQAALAGIIVAVILAILLLPQILLQAQQEAGAARVQRWNRERPNEKPRHYE
jgi:hypothetical protein